MRPTVACPECQASWTGAFSFCGRCGARLSDAEPTPSTRRGRPVPVTAIVTAGVIGLLVLASLVAYRAATAPAIGDADVAVPRDGIDLGSSTTGQVRCTVERREQACSVWRVLEGAGIRGVADIGDVVVTLNINGTVGAIDPLTGEFLWATPTDVYAAFLVPTDRDDRVLVRRDDRWVVLDLGTGAELARHRGLLVMQEQGLLALLTTSPDGRARARLTIVSLATGAPVASWDLPPDEAIVALGDLVITATMTEERGVRVRQLDTGEVRWQIEEAGFAASTTEDSRAILTQGNDGRLVAHDLDTGAILWERLDLGGGHFVEDTTGDLWLVRSGSSSHLQALDRSSGATRFTIDGDGVAEVLESPPGGPILLRRSFAGAVELQAVSAADGSIAWSQPLGDEQPVEVFDRGVATTDDTGILVRWFDGAQARFDVRGVGGAMRVVSLDPLVIATDTALYGLDPALLRPAQG